MLGKTYEMHSNRFQREDFGEDEEFGTAEDRARGVSHMKRPTDFPVCFEALTGYPPFPWQARLYERLVGGNIPPCCDIPTGLGKTAVIPVWLIALAQTSTRQGAYVPRRLVYIVNRRTVVDQATEVVQELRKRLREADSDPSQTTLHDLSQLLRRLAAARAGELLAVSTLRGELADNREWLANPARPAIVIGTIDMIGSKLLFSGYGDGRYGRAHHAGLVGQDALVIHDEAHLSPAFSRLLRAVEDEQAGEPDRGGNAAKTARPIRIMELSATTRRDDDDSLAGTYGWGKSFGVGDDDANDAVVQQRLAATKKLSFVDIDTSKKNALATAIAEQAIQHDDKKCRVLAYVRSPETAAGVRDALAQNLTNKAKQAGGRLAKDDAQKRIRLLTGTIRGCERDQLAESDIFRAFKSDPDRPAQMNSPTLYLVSTSAGEVGVDFDADHLVCDLTTLDSMAQRFGRVNRLGGKGRHAEVTVVCEKPKAGTAREKRREPSPLDAAIAKTGDILRKVAENGGNVSPAALTKVLEAADANTAFSPTPTILPATDILFDSWALTSIMGGLPGRPEVGPYLHGVSEDDPPETYVAWRAEVGELGRSASPPTQEQLTDMLDAFPILAAERARDRVDRVQRELELLAERHPDAPAIIIRNGEPRWTTLSALAPADKGKKLAARRTLAYATVLLPVEVEGLKDGMINGKADNDGKADNPVTDVAELTAGGQRARQRFRVTEEGETPLLGGKPVPGLFPRYSLPLGVGEAADEDSPTARIEYRIARAEGGEPGEDVALNDHSADVGDAARRTAEALDLPSEIVDALALAGCWHDRGKGRECWQRYARNDDRTDPLAKAKRYGDARRLLGGYRHEFGSLHDAAVADEVKNHPERDLVLHLIAAHHGWARPHFRHDRAGRVHDPMHATGENQQVAAEAMRRFARLQRRFGRWGLAWLESLLRCADAMASRAPEGGEA